MTDPYDEIQNPETTAHRLSELAAAHPELGRWIADHPNAYPELRQWIAAYSKPAPPPVVASAPEEHSEIEPRVEATPALEATATSADDASSTTQVPDPRHTTRGRKRLLIGLSIGVVAALVLGGGGWWFFTSRLGGASSPEAAFTKLISGVQSMDPLTLYGSFAPSEVALLQDPLQKLASARDGEDGVDVSALLDEARSSLKITTKDLTFTTEELADGVSRVTWTGGEIVFDGDASKLADATVSAYAPFLRAQDREEGNLNDSQIDDAVADAKRSLADNIDFPYTLSPDRLHDGDAPIALVMVDEGTGWYVSPLLSYADLGYRSAQAAGQEGLAPLGHKVTEATTYASPEDAASGLADAVVSGDVDEVAESLPLPERRLLSVYGQVSDGLFGWYASTMRDLDLKLDDTRFSAVIDGDRARVSIDGLTVTSSQYSSDIGRDLVSSWAIKGTCVDWTREYAHDDGYYVSGDYWWQSDEWISDWTVSEDNGSGCLEDAATMKKLGANDFAIVAVKENGGWLVSPTATLGDAAAIAAGNFIQFYDDGTVDKLYG